VLLKLADARCPTPVSARYAGCEVVTLSGSVLSSRLGHVGEMVTFYASVNHVGRLDGGGLKVVAGGKKTSWSAPAQPPPGGYFTIVAMTKASPWRCAADAGTPTFKKSVFHKPEYAISSAVKRRARRNKLSRYHGNLLAISTGRER